MQDDEAFIESSRNRRRKRSKQNLPPRWNGGEKSLRLELHPATITEPEVWRVPLRTEKPSYRHENHGTYPFLAFAYRIVLNSLHKLSFLKSWHVHISKTKFNFCFASNFVTLHIKKIRPKCRPAGPTLSLLVRGHQEPQDLECIQSKGKEGKAE